MRPPTRTKKDLIRRVAALTDVPLAQCEPWVNATLDALGGLLAAADPEVRIELRDFGVFEVRKTRARATARNPRTNGRIYVPARRKATFRPGKRLQQTLQQPLHELGYDDDAAVAADAESVDARR